MRPGKVTMRQARVVVGVNSQHAATGQLPGKFRLPLSRIASDKECGHKPSSQSGQAGLSGGQASGTTVFPSYSVIRLRRLGKRYPPIWVGLENGALVGDNGIDMTDLLFG